MDLKFEKAIKVVLKHEGGLTVDHAGVTNFGVTLRSLDVDIDLDGDIDSDDIRAMTEADAIAFYYRRWWTQYKYFNIDSAAVATKVFDLAVNMGARQIAKIAQRALRACGHQDIIDDGVLGPKSFQAINQARFGELLAAIRSETAGFYRMLIAKNREARKHNPELPDFSKFERGWLNRAYA